MIYVLSKRGMKEGGKEKEEGRKTEKEPLYLTSLL